MTLLPYRLMSGNHPSKDSVSTNSNKESAPTNSTKTSSYFVIIYIPYAIYYSLHWMRRCNHWHNYTCSLGSALYRYNLKSCSILNLTSRPLQLIDERLNYGMLLWLFFLVYFHVSLNFKTCISEKSIALYIVCTLYDIAHQFILNAISDCGLYITGSSVTGFGSNRCDMDLCLMLSNDAV